MDNVLQVDSDPEIRLGDAYKDMPDEIRGHLIANLTIAAKKHNCHWTELAWQVKMADGQPIIYVKRRP